MYGGDPVDLEEVYDKCRQWSERLSPLIGPVERIVNDALSASKNVLLEGAQGALLDLDHGTYPFVTSSNPTIGGVSVGLGVHPGHISDRDGRVQGLLHARRHRAVSRPS